LLSLAQFYAAQQQQGVTKFMENKIIATLSVKPAWVPEIAQKTNTSTVTTRKTICLMLERGEIDITRKGFVTVRPR
jgi:hypothetical protein